MSSKRELIIQDIVETLKNQQTIRLGTVSRDPGLELQDLAKTAFPAVIVESGSEIRESITQMGSAQQRQATMSVNMSVWIGSSAQADSQRNDLIEKIEELLEVDTTRGGQAIDTQLVEIETGTDTAPYASMNLIFQVQYFYTKGNP
jgi:hypothetical protein